MNNKALRLGGRHAEVMHNSSGKLIKSPFLRPLQLLRTRGVISFLTLLLPSPRPPAPGPRPGSSWRNKPLDLSPWLLRPRILDRGYLGPRVPLSLLGEVFSSCRVTGEAQTGVWCAVEQRVGTISFLHAWLSLSVGTDRLRG